MVAPAIQLFSDDHQLGLVGVRFPVELRAEQFTPDDPSTWPTLEGRLELVGGRLLYLPPCADYLQDVAMDVAFVLRSWSEAHPEFVVGGNEAGMKLGGDVRAADVAVWRAAEAMPRSGRVRAVPPVLAVEVSGEDEAELVLRDKARWYLEHVQMAQEQVHVAALSFHQFVAEASQARAGIEDQRGFTAADLDTAGVTPDELGVGTGRRDAPAHAPETDAEVIVIGHGARSVRSACQSPRPEKPRGAG